MVHVAVSSLFLLSVAAMHAGERRWMGALCMQTTTAVDAVIDGITLHTTGWY